MSRLVTAIRVFGEPAPGGSKKMLPIRNSKRVVLVEASNKVKGWKELVAKTAREQYQKISKGHPVSGVLEVIAEFYLARPKSHYRTGKNSHELKPSVPMDHTYKPDLTKLWRGTEDALSDIVWVDDCQIASVQLSKEWCEGKELEGVWIEVRTK
jgi:crossover junction endodeoxyribonuclease RusA